MTLEHNSSECTWMLNGIRDVRKKNSRSLFLIERKYVVHSVEYLFWPDYTADVVEYTCNQRDETAD